MTNLDIRKPAISPYQLANSHSVVTSEAVHTTMDSCGVSVQEINDFDGPHNVKSHKDSLQFASSPHPQCSNCTDEGIEGKGV